MSKPHIAGRTLARAQAMQILFQAEATKRSVASVLAGEYVLETGPLDDYAATLARGTADYLAGIDALLNAYAPDWRVDRMPSVDRNLLRVAMYELLKVDEVADAVVIDEAVELAKAYSTEDSRRFINGVLGRVVDDAAANPQLLDEACAQAQSATTVAGQPAADKKEEK